MNSPAPRRARWGRWLGVTAAGSVLAALSLAGAPAASAAGDNLQFSLDGQQFETTLASPVFAESFVYVPGSTSSAALWVRNNSPEPAALSSAAVMVRSDPELAGYLGLQTGLQPDPASRAVLGGQGSCTDVGRSWNIEAGGNVKLDFTADLALEAPNETRNRSAEFDIVFVLESGAAGTGPRSVCAALGSTPGEPGGTGNPQTGGTGDGGDVADTAVRQNDSDRRVIDLVTVPGTQGAADTSSGFVAQAAAPGRAGTDQATPKGTAPEARVPRPDVEAAGFQSTVEPVIRSLSGTLLIAMSVALAAAVVLRLREGRRHG